MGLHVVPIPKESETSPSQKLCNSQETMSFACHPGETLGSLCQNCHATTNLSNTRLCRKETLQAVVIQVSWQWRGKRVSKMRQKCETRVKIWKKTKSMASRICKKNELHQPCAIRTISITPTYGWNFRDNQKNTQVISPKGGPSHLNPFLKPQALLSVCA